MKWCVFSSHSVETGSESIEALLYQWKEVAVFFMLRLVLAPCVETALMLDRLLFLMEQGYVGSLSPYTWHVCGPALVPFFLQF